MPSIIVLSTLIASDWPQLIGTLCLENSRIKGAFLLAIIFSWVPFGLLLVYKRFSSEP